MQLELLVRSYARMIGLARYTVSLRTFLERAGVAYQAVEPVYPLPVKVAHAALRPFGHDVRTFFTTFPVSAPLSRGAVKHFTAQMMASLYSFQPGLEKVVITVHDIVPYMTRDDPEQNVLKHFYDRWMDDRSMNNLRRADRLICISRCTANMLVEKLGCSPEKIRVIPNGLDHGLFHPVTVLPDFWEKFQLSPQYRYLLYVGSENPRKNLPRLIQAFAKLKKKIDQVKLIKIGTPEYFVEYRKLQEQIQSAGLSEDVLFISHTSQDDLIRFYSIADAFVFPSLYEGFGLPPLEAMACGAPVICSNASSLPEVVGDAALLVDPYDVDRWAEAMARVLEDESLRQRLKTLSLVRAAEFTWERAIRETVAVYHEVNEL
jgi:glycosyltransferase involved in cell wall biosynthesis